MPSVFGLHSLLRGAATDLAQGRNVQVAGVSEALAEWLVLALARGSNSPETKAFRHLVVVLPTAKSLPPWSHFLDQAIASLGDETGLRGAVLPFFSCYGNDRFINPSLSRRQRIYALSQLSNGEQRNVIITTAQALGQRTLAPSVMAGAAVRLQKDTEYDQDDLIARLDDLGYTPSPAVSEEGAYAVRGGIVDVFPMNADDPLRLEFVGDALASLRCFSVDDQKSKHTVERAVICPAYEALAFAANRKDDAQRLYNTMLEQNVVAADRQGMLSQFQQGVKFSGFDMYAPLFRVEAASSLSYCGPDTLLLFPEGVDACLERYEALYEAISSDYQRDLDRQRASLPPEEHYTPPADFAAALRGRSPHVEFGNPFASAESTLYRVEARLKVAGAPESASVGAELFDKWLLVIDGILKKDGTVAILAHHDEQIDRISNLLVHRGFKPKLTPALMGQVLDGVVPPGISIGKGDSASHLWLDEQNLLILPELALFGSKAKIVKPASQKLQNYLSSFADLKVGDLVVHVQHGIGRYRGLTSLTVLGLTSDFLILEYAGGDKIYLPVDRLSLLQRYSAGSEAGAAMYPVDRLGGLSWERRRARVKGAVKDMADQLLKLQAQRAIARGMAFSAPDDSYVKFEAGFPYDETEDQTRAIHDVEADLRSGRPMDRLICGDVGFGKTEVALRASLRTVLEGAQVLVLVPTTILCYQHYRTFSSRLEAHGVRVAQVNRFVSAADIKAATNGLQSGAVDVLIGTHRLLSKDVKPKRLGLLVIDEEQRFGVSHKESLKELRAGAHALTLTATPIPRTLHMSMVGLRDISIIATPPQDRLAVKTYISRFDETLIKDAIEQEIRRGGQVFFVHNRVEDIEEMRLYLKSLVPHLDIRVGHGQMREHQLERVIVDFLEQKFPILLCTTIIESGVDMPNVNTLIVNKADRFGLAQLYQLRGRVGRSNLQAYAYFLTPPEERLSDEGKKRLDVLAAHQELGAGFQIASHDLELRGAGNLLGGEQSGHAAEVGLELYTEMLEAAIHELRGEPVKERIDTEIKIPVSALIPAEFVPVETQRLHLYKSLFAADSGEDLAVLRQDVADRYGPLPAEFARLFKVARLKQLLRRLGALRLTAGRGVFEIRFAPLGETQIDHLLKAAAHRPESYKLAPDAKLLLFLDYPASPSAAQQDEMLQALIGLVDPLAAATEPS